MKYENIKRVQEICKQIDSQMEIMEQLDLKHLYIRIVHDDSGYIMDIDPKTKSDREYIPILHEFFNELKQSYTDKLDKLHAELDLL